MKEGKFKDGKLINWIKTKGKNSLGNVLDIVGEFTGKEMIEQIGESLKDDKTISDEERKELNKLLELELKELEIIESNLTERHKNDMLSDSWLSKNVRPIVVLNFTALIDYVILSAIHGKPIKEQFLGLIMTLGVSTIGGYFALRSTEKRNKNKYNK